MNFIAIIAMVLTSIISTCYGDFYVLTPYDNSEAKSLPVGPFFFVEAILDDFDQVLTHCRFINKGSNGRNSTIQLDEGDIFTNDRFSLLRFSLTNVAPGIKFIVCDTRTKHTRGKRQLTGIRKHTVTSSILAIEPDLQCPSQEKKISFEIKTDFDMCSPHLNNYANNVRTAETMQMRFVQISAYATAGVVFVFTGFLLAGGLFYVYQITHLM